jgi:DNA-binding HxlR family transcriptional regulator
MVIMLNDTLLGTIAPYISIQSTGRKDINMDSIWKAFRKLSNRNTVVVVKALLNDGKTFRELQTETGLIVNDLNHVLYDLKAMNLVVAEGSKKREVKYYLTSYCVILLDAIDGLQMLLESIDDKDMFSVHKAEMKPDLSKLKEPNI